MISTIQLENLTLLGRVRLALIRISKDYSFKIVKTGERGWKGMKKERETVQTQKKDKRQEIKKENEALNAF